MKATIAIISGLFTLHSLAQEETAAMSRSLNNSKVTSTDAASAGVSGLEAARVLFTAGDHQGAVEVYNELIERDPRNAAALWARSESYVQLGEQHRAETDLWNILGIHQRGAYAERAFLKLGEHSMANNDPRSAEIFFDRYVRIAPEEPQAWCKRGIARMALHQDEEALDDLQQAIALDPYLDLAHVNKALVLLRMGFRQEGCAALQLAHDLGDLSTEEMLLIHCDR